MTLSKLRRALLGRPDIKEIQYSGANFSRGYISKYIQRLQGRFPNHKFLGLLPYENWKPSQWTSGDELASLFSLLDIMMRHKCRLMEGIPITLIGLSSM
jgi:hypothetical protein